MNISSASLAPWEGDDVLASAKEVALAALREGAVSIPRHPAVAVPAPQQSIQDEQPQKSPPEDLPEIRAFVRSLGGLNSIAIFKDLSAAGLMSRRAGRYQQRPRRPGDVEWFRSVKVGGEHSVFVTPAGQGLLKQLKKNGKLTKALTKSPLTPRQKTARERTREATRKRSAERKAALVKRQPEVLARLDAVIQASIERREARVAKLREAVGKGTGDAC